METRLEQYLALGLGLETDSLRLVPHHPRWKRAFSDEAHLVFDTLRIEGLRLYHVGSTSVPGITAKPVIDIVGSVPSLAELDSKAEALEALGYEQKGECGIPGRRYFVLHDPRRTRAYFHLHLFEPGGGAIDEHLLFRDFLRAEPEAARTYEAGKNRLIQAGIPREKYSEAKSDLVQDILKKAREWQPPSRKILVLLGSAKGGENTRTFLNQQVPETAEVILLRDRKILPYVYGPEGEHAPDEYIDIATKMAAADLIVFATPVYWYSMSAPLKLLFDRFSNLLRGKDKGLGEALYGRKAALVATGFDDRLPPGFEVPFASTAIYFGMDYLGARYRKF